MDVRPQSDIFNKFFYNIITVQSYQTLAVVGGVLGIMVVFAVFITLELLSTVVEFLGGEKQEQGQVQAQIAVSIALYTAAIIIPFVLKETKLVGGFMLALAVAVLIFSGWFGIIGFGLLIAPGIAALRYKRPMDAKPFDTKPTQ